MRMKKLLVCLLVCSVLLASTGADVMQVQAAKSKTSETTSETVKEGTTKKGSAKKTSKKKKKAYTQSQLRLMSCIIYCEAGIEPYAGKQAVGIVIMNRIASSSFPDTLKGVIYQKYQFGPVRNGSLNRALTDWDNGEFTNKYQKACIKAAKYALKGNKTVTYKGEKINMKSYKYFSGWVSNHKLEIGGHQFK